MPIPFKKALFVAFTASLFVGCKSEPLKVQIAHLNDTHSHFDEQLMQLKLPDENGNQVSTYAYVGGYPRMVSLTQKMRSDAQQADTPFLLLHAGDAFEGTLFFTLFKGELNAEFMNLMNFDAMAIGNHEFDLGNSVLANFADKIQFPLLSANTITAANDELHGKYLPFTIKTFHDQLVAVVGLTTTYAEIISSPSDTTSFSDEIASARQTVALLSKSGINKIVFLTHIGLDLDKSLAEQVPGIDVIIGGHSSELLGDNSNIGLGNDGPSPILLTGPKGDPVCIMHSGEHALALGITDVDFDKKGVVEHCAAKNVFPVGDFFAQGLPPTQVSSAGAAIISDFIANAPNIEIVEKDQEAQIILDQAKADVAAFSSSIIGVAAEPLYHIRLPGDVHPTQGSLPNGSMVAPQVAASMAAKMTALSGDTYISIMNAGGVRADLTGNITVGSAYTVLPFSSTLVTMTVSGESFAQTLQSNVANAYAISGVAFPYVANVHYTIDFTTSGSPLVKDIEVLSSDGSFEPIQASTSYHLVTTSYLAGGGDLYSFAGATDIMDTGHIDATALVEYIQAQPGAVLSPIESGITLLK